jgi:hypothetical protein
MGNFQDLAVGRTSNRASSSHGFVLFPFMIESKRQLQRVAGSARMSNDML